MRNLVVLLTDFAWVLYAACGLVAMVYVARAFSLRRRIGLSLTTFERETLNERIVQSWRAAVVFIGAGLILFALQEYILPTLPLDELIAPPETPAGMITPTATAPPTATPISGAMPTIDADVTPPPQPTVIPTQIAEEGGDDVEPTATAEPSPTLEQAPSIALGDIRLGNVAELVGYDLTTTEVNTGEGIGLILYWRALEGSAASNYAVFTHLRTPEGQLIAQHDGAPVNGTRPTTSWTPGEILLDFHQMVFLDEGTGYTGSAQIIVGLYDPAAPENRVAVEGGGDFVLLPTNINVLGP
jgi:hypothetical protein